MAASRWDALRSINLPCGWYGVFFLQHRGNGIGEKPHFIGFKVKSSIVYYCMGHRFWIHNHLYTHCKLSQMDDHIEIEQEMPRSAPAHMEWHHVWHVVGYHVAIKIDGETTQQVCLPPIDTTGAGRATRDGRFYGRDGRCYGHFVGEFPYC